MGGSNWENWCNVNLDRPCSWLFLEVSACDTVSVVTCVTATVWCGYYWMAGKHVRSDRVDVEWSKRAGVGLWCMGLLTTFFVIIDLPAWSVTIMVTDTGHARRPSSYRNMHLCLSWQNIFNLRQEIIELEHLHKSTCFTYWIVRGNLNSRGSFRSRIQMRKG